MYKSDWTDAFADLKKVIPAVLFLYFACLSPAVSFGTIASQITDGSIGIVEFLVSCGGSGMVRFVTLEELPLSRIHGPVVLGRDEREERFTQQNSFQYVSVSNNLKLLLLCATFLALCHFLWTANVIHCPNRPHSSIYIGTVPILCSERTPVLSCLQLGGPVDVLLLCISRTCRIQCTYSLLHEIHRRSIQCAAERQFYL